jgi:hypothetical protein
MVLRPAHRCRPGRAGEDHRYLTGKGVRNIVKPGHRASGRRIRACDQVVMVRSRPIWRRSGRNVQSSALTGKEQERIGLARQAVVLYEAILACCR